MFIWRLVIFTLVLISALLYSRYDPGGGAMFAELAVMSIISEHFEKVIRRWSR